MSNSKKCRIKIWAAILVFMVSISGNISMVKASELSKTSEISEESANVPPTADQEWEAAVEIWDAEGLCAMAEDPFGMYLLAADIDMSGKAWTPFAFHGSLD